MNKDIRSLVRPNILGLEPYSTARDEYQGGSLGVFLDANESPYENGVNRYPDPHQKALKARISQIKGIPVANIFLGNGSDEAIDLVLRVFCTPGKDNVVAIAPSYGMYAVAAATNDIQVRSVALGQDWSLPVDEILSNCDACTKAVFICSPNNPTGNAFPAQQILDIADKVNAMVVVDEAYIDFSSQPSLSAHIGTHNNIIILQTLSKAWGMAGMRIGMAFADESVIELMSRVKYPYNINCLAQQKALEMLQAGEPDIKEIIRDRQMLSQRLAAMPFVHKVYPSDANFLLVKTTDANRIYDYLIDCGIIVRNRNRVLKCQGCLRITVGTSQENEKLLQALENYGTEAKR